MKSFPALVDFLFRKISKNSVENLLRFIILCLLIVCLLGLHSVSLFSVLGDILQSLISFIVPLSSALFLLLLPLIIFMNPVTKSMLSGLFVMSKDRQYRQYRQFCFSIVSIFFVADTILTVIYPLIFSILIQETDKRYEYKPLKDFFEKYTLEEVLFKDPSMAKIIYVIAIIILVLPTISAIVKANLKDDDDKENRNIILFLLTVITLGLVLFKNLYNKFIINIMSEEIVNEIFIKIMFFLKSPISKNVDNVDQYYLVNWLASFALFLIIYIIIFILYWPNKKRDQNFFTINSTPAFMYIMLIVIMSTHLLSYIQYLSFRFTIYRNIPILLIVPLGVYIICHWVFNINYFFSLGEKINSDVDTHTFRQILEKRANKLESYIKSKSENGECTPEQKQTLVVVCASGGGIQATGWTVKVLTGLQELLGPSFTLATGLISSVSGGSVGTMYYLDYLDYLNNLNSKDSNQSCSCQNLKNFDKTSQDDIFERATSDSLGAVGWGLAYPDFFRFFGLPSFNPTINRGWAIESYWKQQMKNPDSSLSKWRDQIIWGNLPIPVFNTTTVEDGYRLLISPMNFIDNDEDKKCARDFNTVYKGFDLHVATAARLSATFPYISPTCRAYIPSTEKISNLQKYHIADGGYFDNSGVFTAVEWLDDLLQKDENPIKRVLVIMINPFPVPNTDSNAPQDGNNPKSKGFSKIKSLLSSVLIESFSGVINTLISPVLTLFKVRNSTLNSRNHKELELLKNHYNPKVEIEIVPINYPSGIDKNTPLSWKLTRKQKDNINKAWDHDDCRDQISDVEKIWKDWEMPTD